MPKSTTHQSTKQLCQLDSEDNNCEGLQDGPLTPHTIKHVENRRSEAEFCFKVRGTSTVLVIRTMTGYSTQTLPSAFPSCVPAINFGNAARLTSALRYLNLVVLCYVVYVDE